MHAGMGDGGGCHPRDNIALRYMADKLDLGYDLFQAIMEIREKQAKNLADVLNKYHKETGLPVVILGKSYKPHVEYLEGSYGMLVGSYVDSNVLYDTVLDTPAIYLLGHKDVFKDTKVVKGSVIVDPWRQKEPEQGIILHSYGNTRNS